jgi:uncharacterized protein (UPF0333 family)
MVFSVNTVTEQMVSNRNKRKLILFIIIIVGIFITTWYLRSFDTKSVRLYAGSHSSFEVGNSAKTAKLSILIESYDHQIGVQQVSKYVICIRSYNEANEVYPNCVYVCVHLCQMGERILKTVSL